MKKNEIAKYINSKFPDANLNAGKNGNVVYANINKTRDDLWWADVGIEKFTNDLHFILQNQFENNIVWVKIPKKTILDPLQVFYNKNTKQVSLYISTSSLKEIKNNRFDFVSFKVFEFACDDLIGNVSVSVNDKARNESIKILSNGKSNISGSRYGYKPIGDSQNAMIRSLLSSIGFEKYSKNEWISVCDVHFEGKCAYCEENSTQIDHAVPMNKKDLGEHRLGNIVPSCKKCNSDKGQKWYDQYLNEKYGNGAFQWISRIETHMEMCGYEPIFRTKNKLVINEIMEDAHNEVRALFIKYQEKLNKLEMA